MIVDDSRDAADSVGFLLETMSCQTRVFYRGLQALHEAPDFMPQVALLDIDLPDIDGCSLARDLRAASNAHPITLIAITGWDKDVDRARARAAGFDHYLVKPVSIHEVVDILLRVAAARGPGCV
ncbi:response regulator [Cupriavidus agavae]|uniref:response regulator n=1 Tax=Cupriavidus agavae TaxID=1001822 RepID=UPI0013004284|nr:response regulator [Cupriavidus agavae]